MKVPSSLWLFSFVSLLTLVASQSLNPPARFLRKKYEMVNNKRMAYVEVGTGDPIVFLHGNPTSSYLWRNVMPVLEGKGRLIAPDLIGMGDSDKLDRSGPNRYTVSTHSNYLYYLLEKLGVKTRVTLVTHDWGSALGFLWAYNNRFNADAVKGIVFMETAVAPLPDYKSVFSPEEEELFRAVRSPAGERLILKDNVFIESGLPSAIIRNLTMEEMNEYRRPFFRPGEDRRAILTFPRQIPIGGVPSDVFGFVSAYSKWLETSDVPKLFIDVSPGLLSPFTRGIVSKWKVVDTSVVKGIHFVQEDAPVEIGKEILRWCSQRNM